MTMKPLVDADGEPEESRTHWAPELTGLPTDRQIADRARDHLYT
jgi:hypothetical protein